MSVGMGRVRSLVPGPGLRPFLVKVVALPAYVVVGVLASVVRADPASVDPSVAVWYVHVVAFTWYLAPVTLFGTRAPVVVLACSADPVGL